MASKASKLSFIDSYFFLIYLSRRRGMSVCLFERGATLASNVLSWGHVTLFSPNSMNCSTQVSQYPYYLTYSSLLSTWCTKFFEGPGSADRTGSATTLTTRFPHRLSVSILYIALRSGHKSIQFRYFNQYLAHLGAWLSASPHCQVVVYEIQIGNSISQGTN